MRFDALTVMIRPRSAVEASDLGTRLVQVHRRALTVAMLQLLLPVVLISDGIALWWPSADWVWWLLAWWCKPLYDRAILHVLGLAVFGERLDYRARLRALPGLLRIDVLRAMTWGRLSPNRSFLLPVVQLEGLRGKAARRREQLLLGGQANGLFALLTSCSLIETALLLACSLGMIQFLPRELQMDLPQLLAAATKPGWVRSLLHLGYLIAIVATEPVFVGAGFAIYLARRTELEAWDVELALRRLAARLERTRQPSTLGTGT